MDTAEVLAQVKRIQIIANRQVNDLLDVAIDDIGPYNLEVSSPGPERPLGRESDFDRFKGYFAKLKTRQPIEGKTWHRCH